MIRRPGRKPTLALWMLVALADVAILVAARPMPALAGVALLALATVAVVLLARRFPATEAADPAGQELRSVA
jgi:hypothetical protein